MRGRPINEILDLAMVEAVRARRLGACRSNDRRLLHSVPHECRQKSSQLTVLAASPVIAAELGRLAIVLALTRQTQANTGNGVSARLRNLDFTFRAVS